MWLYGYAVVRLCGCAVMRLCGYVVMWLYNPSNPEGLLTDRKTVTMV